MELTAFDPLGEPDAYRAATRATPSRLPVFAPESYAPLDLDVLMGLLEVPCAVFVHERDRYVLYADSGADAGVLRALAGNEVGLFVRDADIGLLRRTVAGRLADVLVAEHLTPVERSRAAYAMATEVIADLFVEGKFDQVTVETSCDAIDAIGAQVLRAESLFWDLVMSMRHRMDTYTHALNSAVYAVMLASLVGMGDAEQARNIGRGALLRDIGNVRVPAAILNKPGPLSEEEWSIIRTHPRMGHDLLVDTLGSELAFGHIVLQHHERCDGSGYPNRYHGPRIARDSQVVAVADAYDALTSLRPYRAAYSPFEALRIMRFEMTGQFNDEILRAFIELMGGRSAVPFPAAAIR